MRRPRKPALRNDSERSYNLAPNCWRMVTFDFLRIGKMSHGDKEVEMRKACEGRISREVEGFKVGGRGLGQVSVYFSWDTSSN